YGGLGQNFMNPALAARCFLLISFAGIMTNFPAVPADAVSSATPLAVIKSGEGNAALFDMFFGLTSGTIGEISAFLLILGGIYLIVRKVITWDIPVVYIGTVAVFMFLFGTNPFDLTYTAQELCGGGLMLGAFFMATDYVTSPITPKGRILYAFVIGCLTGIFRTFGNAAEGVSYAIILGNIMVPLIERVTLPKAFGREGK
ncbi:MAG: RnfABCDGE type electron transport complex subunit D, partial [Clostridiales bacterium]|nr:RnfABCDGE type electron transport complex subunit D [Clostridiales bacterium]